MNSLDALRTMVANYPGGREVVAARLDKSDEVLRKELSGAPTHKLGVIDAELIASMCADANSAHRSAYANAVCLASGGAFRLRVIDMADPSAAKTLQTLSATAMRETAEAALSVAEGDADGVISDNDLRRGLAEVEEAREALQSLENALRAKHANGKPVPLRNVA